jgi:chromosome partitioning protein
VKVLASYTLKGGVGKTSAAVNLAHLAAEGGLRTLVWDLDPQGAATYLFRIRPKVKGGGEALVEGRRDVRDAVKGTDFDRLDLLPADFSYRHLDLELDAVKHSRDRLRQLLAPLADEYDLVVLDCPPGVTLLSENVVRASDVLLVPLVPAVLSLRTLDQLTGFVAGLSGRGPTLLAFLSMVDRRKRAHRDLVTALPAEHDTVAPVAVPNLAVVERMAVERAPVTVFAPRSAAATAYRQLWAVVRDRLAAPHG